MLEIKVQNSTVTYVDEGKGKTVVLLHGFCGSQRYWENVIPALSGEYRVIVPDLPGHGGSSTLEGNYTMEALAEHIRHFLDTLGIAQVTMFGHSLGGYAALAFAEKFSERLNGFSLVHSTAFPDSEEAKKGRETNIEKVKKEGIGALINGLVPKLFSPDHLDRDYVATAKEIGDSTSPQGAINTLSAMKDRPDRNRVLESTSLPVLLVAGEKDQIIPSEKTFSISGNHIKQVVIGDSGHMSMYENPDVLVSVMKEFLAGLN